MGHDGYGRLKTRITPEQGTTIYSYFGDDTVQTVTDARGATKTFAYNNRHLPTSITFSVPAGVAATPNVSFSYDAAGNRTSMADGQGSVTYVYDQLSRLTTETRSFTGLGSFPLTYGYNAASELTSVTSPSSAQVGYTYDSYGRLTAVTGSGYAGVTSYASGLQYRAFGALKQMTYGNKSLSLEYDARMRLSKWDLQGMLGYTYGYSNYGENSTGHVTFAHSLYDSTLDRAWHYDQVGRLDAAYTGSEARAMIGTDSWGHPDGPFAQTYQYDQYGNMTQMYGWGAGHAYTSASYLDNKNQAFSYDAAGNVLSDGGQSYSYDAAGRQVTSSFGLTNSYDGNGLRAKKVDGGVTTYYVRSSVLGGQVVSEVNGSGSVQRGYVYTGGQLLALQSNGGVQWVSQEPYSKGQRITDGSGNLVAAVELDPWGADTSKNANAAFQPHRFTTYERDGNGSDDAMARRYNRYWNRFDQPDPYDGSLNVADPQSFNRYTYTQNDPVNFTDPSGLDSKGLQNLGTVTVTAGPGQAEILMLEFALSSYLFLRNDNVLFQTGTFDVDISGRGGEPPTPTPAPILVPEPQGGKRDRCQNATQDAQSARQFISRRLQNAIRVGGLDAGHQKAIGQSLNQLKNAVADIAKNCFGDDGPGGPPLIPELESSIRLSQQAAEEFKVPPVGWDGGRTSTERRIKSGIAMGVVGGAVFGAASSLWNGLKWVFGY